MKSRGTPLYYKVSVILIYKDVMCQCNILKVYFSILYQLLSQLKIFITNILKNNSLLINKYHN